MIDFNSLSEIIKNEKVSKETGDVINSVPATADNILNFRCSERNTYPSKFIEIFEGRKYHLDRKGIKNIGFSECIQNVKQLAPNTEILTCMFSSNDYHYKFLLQCKDSEPKPLLIGCFMWAVPSTNE